MKKTRVLVVDDEPRYVRVIQVALESRGYQVLTARDGQEAIEVAACEQPDLAILDVRLPWVDGFAACRRIREFSQMPIIFLTALAEESDVVRGLEGGADDYITKPFSIPELLARVQAVVRRSQLTERQERCPVLEIGQLRVDLAQQRVFAGEREVALTPTEYHLLAELARHGGHVLTPAHLLEQVWGAEYAGEERLVRKAIYRLRQKVEADPRHPRIIRTKPGLGYWLERRDS